MTDNGDFMSGLRLARRGMLSVVGALLAAPAWGQVMGPNPVVATTNGPVRGLWARGVVTFKGIRYGADTGGAGRFRAPVRPAPWREVLNAFEYGPPASQEAGFLAAMGNVLKEDLGGIPPAYPFEGSEKIAPSEDCLFLNVCTPAVDGARRPVMVWLHGGGFFSGSGGGPLYDGTNFATKEDVVVVTVNHRLGAFGYGYMAELLGPDYASSGNVGMLDLVLALEWVRDNIGRFGGDPGRVTIFGESGGGMKVSTLLAMEKAKGLFHRAIVQSGPLLQGVPRAEATELSRMVLHELGIPLNEPRRILDIPAIQLTEASTKAANRFAEKSPRLGGNFAPVVDQVVLPTDPFDPGAPPTARGIPLLIGNTRTEATLFMTMDTRFGHYTDAEVTEIVKKQWGSSADKIISTAMRRRAQPNGTSLYAEVLTASWLLKSHQMADRQAQNGAPVYFYRLDWLTPVGGGKYEAPHMLDVPMVFDTLDAARMLVGRGPEPQRVSDQMRAAWAAFARTANPTNRLIPKWPAYSEQSKAVMSLNVESQVLRDPDADLRDSWKNVRL